MKRTVQKFLPSRSQVASSTSSFRRSLKLDNINLIHDFYIELNEPHRVWRPGDNVTGVVVLDLKKNITNINLTLSIVGYIKVKQSTSTTTVRNKPTVLFKHTTIVYGYDPNEISQDNNEDEPGLGLSKGEHRFPFSMKLPKKNIYTSITFEKGSIAYSLRASINHNQGSSPLSSSTASPASISTLSNIITSPLNSIQHCEKNIQIIVPINVAKLPKPQPRVACLKISDKKLKKTLSSTSTVNSNVTQHTSNSDHSAESSDHHSNSSYPVKLIVELPQSGYLKGELIPIKIKVMHYKPIQSSNGIIVTLARICRVDNGPEAPIQSFRKDLSQTIAPLYIDPETLGCEVNTSLRVPIESFPTIVGSDIVTFQYYIEVLANVSNKNLIPPTVTQPPTANSTAKFSHSIVFDIESSHDRELLNSEDGMLNVDKLKRTKNLIGLNTEIVVGTERKIKEKVNIGKKTILAHAANKQQINNSENFNNNINFDHDESILEAISQNSISPLSINSGGVNGANYSVVIPTGEEIQIIPRPLSNENMTEKERLRLQEQLLLPSEPIDYDISPAPSYSLTTSDNQQYSHSSSRSNSTEDTPSEDKAELERRRLQTMESEPPEFDYVPEYSNGPAGHDFLHPSSISINLLNHNNNNPNNNNNTTTQNPSPPPPSHFSELETLKG